MQTDKYQLQTTEIPGRAFTKVSGDLIVELPTSHYHNKNILVMVDHLTGWPIAKAIPNKEATIVANAIFKKLILEHGACLKSFFLTMVRSSSMIPWPMYVRSSTLNSILQVPTHPGQMER